MEMNNRDTIKKRVIEFVAEYWVWSPDDLDEDTDLYRDLGIFGDDVNSLFVALSKEFDLPPDKIDLQGCFPGEAHLLNPFPAFFFKPKRRIQIKHLIDAVLFKRWPEFETVRRGKIMGGGRGSALF